MYMLYIYALYIRSDRQVQTYLHMYARMYGCLRAPVACIPACVWARACA